MNAKLIRRIILALALIGLATAGYLVWAKVTNTSVVCIGFNGCDIVQQSAYSEVNGIPVSVIGLIGYIGIITAIIIEERAPDWSQIASYAGFGMSLIGVIYSAYLTYLEAFVILAYCVYCVTSAVVMVLIFAANLYRMTALQPEN